MKTSLKQYSRIEVKAALQQGRTIWLGAADGLYRYDGATAEPLPAWRGREIRALGPGSRGFYVVAGGDDAQAAFRCDWNGAVEQEIALPHGAKAKAISGANGHVWLGTKIGVHRHDGKAWSHVFGGNGKAEVIAIWEQGGTVRASIKKMAPDDKPALATTGDDGATWTVERMPDYQDIYLAADDTRIITRWRGARRRDATKHEYKKHPLTAGWIGGSGTAVLDGEKLEMMPRPRIKIAVHHPMMAEAEHVFPTERGAVFAGPQGAWEIAAATGAVRDLMPPVTPAEPMGKTKKLYVLDDGVVVAATTFGAFRSENQAQDWSPSDAEWCVLDAEGLARDAEGTHWLMCQRGLFRSPDNGRRWDYQKLKPMGRHYAEFRAIAIAGDALLLGTKAGLFSGLAMAAGNIVIEPVAAFGERVIEALACDVGGRRVFVVDEDGACAAYDPATKQVEELGRMPGGEVKLAVLGQGHVLAVGKQGAAELRDGKLAPVDVPAGDKRSLAQAGELVLLWDAGGAWLRSPAIGWQKVAGWPEGVRHVTIDAARRLAYTTDRRYIHRVQL